MKFRFINARILTMEDPLSIIEGELHVDGEIITYVGAALEKVDTRFDQIIDCNGNVLMPGFKNAHTHSQIGRASCRERV